MRTSNEHGVAIVGIATELPSGSEHDKNLDYNSFFPFLLNKEESYSKIPVDRLNIDVLRGHALGQVLPSHGSFLKDIGQFDHLELGVTAKDARAMPVSIRKLLEVSFLSLLDSGIDYRGHNVGCYMAGVVHDIQMISGQDEAEAKGSFSGTPAMVANRISYHFDLRGPSIPVDTACSSSLVATHLAVQGILSGECEAAVVGGAQINIRFSDWLNYTQSGILSEDGKCKPFDASADGFGRAEGVVVMVLKPLSKAISDNDHIYGTILGTGINSAGSLAPVYAPVASAQEEAMRRAFSQAQRNPREVDYVELHATGTARGDPTEANWVGKEFSRDSDLIIGSLKGNLGHLEISSFLGSLAKVCGIFASGLIPATANLTTPNPAIKFAEYRLRAPTQITQLSRRSRSGRALVAMTSSGIGGANGHAVVESAPPVARDTRPAFWREGQPAAALTVVGGLSPRSTAALVDAVKTHIGTAEARLALARRARSMTWRSFGVSELGTEVRFSEPTLASKGLQPIVFVFSGQGPQHMEMGRELFCTCRIFHDSVIEMDAVFERVTGESLIKTYGLFADRRADAKPLGDTWPIAITLPALTVVQLATFDTLVSLGIAPDAIVGHSAGETALLYASGAASRAAAVELSIARGRGMSVLEDKEGTMAAVNCSPAQADNIIGEVKAELGPGSLEIGCFNTPDAITLSGSARYIDVAVEKASGLGIFARRLRTRVPVHSSMMELASEEYQTHVGKVFEDHEVGKPVIPIYSSMSGARLDQEMDANYFWTNTRGPVRFTEALNALVEDYGDATFVELSPHPVLAAYLSTLGGKNAAVVCPLRRPNRKKGETAVEVISLLTCLGQLAVGGHNQVDYALLAGPHVKPSRDLPAYPFAPKQVPYIVPSTEIARVTQPRNGPLNFPQLRVNVETHPSLAQHVIKGEVIMPAAGYLEMALEFGARKVWSAEFLSIIGLSSARPIPVRVHLDESQWTVKSSPVSDVTTWPPKYDRLHAQGFLSKEMTAQERCPVPLELDMIRARCSPVEMRTFYEDMKYFAEYGPEYQRIFSLHRGTYHGRDEALVGIKGLTDDLAKSPSYILHPAILDAAIHAVVHPELTQVKDKGLYYLPSKVKLLIVHDLLLDLGMPAVIYTHVISRKWTPASLVYDCYMVDSNGFKLCTIEGLEVARHGDILAGQISRRYTLVHELTPLAVQSSRVSSPSLVDVDAIQESDLSESSATLDHADFTHVIYRCGCEMEIKDNMARFDVMAERTVWFTAQEGLDGAAALGFSRTIRCEYPAWTIRLAVVDSAWSVADHSMVVAQLVELADVEDEIAVDAQGRITVPRVNEMLPPTRTAPFNPTKPWVVEKGRIVQTPHPHLEDGQVVVEDAVFVEATDTVKGFIGRVKGMDGPVMGVTDGPVSNFVVVPAGSLVPMFNTPEALIEAPPLLAMVIAVLSLGTALFSNSDRLRNPTILVTHADSAVGTSIVSIFSALELKVIPLSSNATPFDLGACEGFNAKLVVSGYLDAGSNAILRRALARDGKLFAWNDAERGVSAVLREEPWAVGEALRVALETMSVKHLKASVHLPLELLDGAPLPGQPVEKIAAFDPSKAYMLVGGIGSLGFQIAGWMYEHGARHFVMTSRSGPASIRERGDTLSQRTLGYLESLEDLTLQLVAVDALSVEGMQDLVKNIGKPLGGCILLTVVLRDRPFAKQTEESLSTVWRAKVEVFEVLERACDISSLDWLVAFSSVTGFLGSAGQTNYAAANTALEALVNKYKNAFSIVAPLIIDSTVATPENAGVLRHLWNWGLSAREICVCIGDGIRKLDDAPFSLYIPDFDWNKVAEWNWRAPAYAHLLKADDVPGANDSDHASLEKVVTKLLDVSADDFSPEVPLTNYGLDSLSASRLSVSLKPFLTITQMQLLGDVSLNDIRAKMEENGDKTAQTIQE